MKAKKMVTPKVVAANKKNAQRSTGPKTAPGKRSAAANRRSHGLLAMTIVFGSDEEKAQYEELLELWTRDSDPNDMVEAALIKHVVDALWRLQQVSPWESAALLARRRSSLAIVQAMAQDSATNFDAPDLPIVNLEPFRDAIAGWECSEVVLTSGKSKDITPRQSPLAPSEERAGDQVAIGAKLTSSLETVMRYRSMITRELHRALELLTRHRAQVCGAE